MLLFSLVYNCLQMVRTYKTKSTRGAFVGNTLQQALNALKEGMSLKKAATTYESPRSTLRRHRDARVRYPGTVRLGSFEPVLNADFENELANQIQLMERALFGLTTVDVRRLAFELAAKMKLPNKFSKESKMAGTDWLKGFMTRQPQLSRNDLYCVGWGVKLYSLTLTLVRLLGR